MTDYPVLFDLKDRLCVVVGGGEVGMRKVRGLLAAGATVRLVDPAFAEDKAVPEGIEVRSHPFVPADLDGAFLAFAATNDRDTNAFVAQCARTKGGLVSIADDRKGSDFALPAVLRRGGVTIGVSTGGLSPALAVVLRDHLEESLDPGWAEAVDIAAALRRNRLTPQQKSEYNQSILRSLIEGGLLSLVAAGDRGGIDRLIDSVVAAQSAQTTPRPRPPEKGTK